MENSVVQAAQRRKRKEEGKRLKQQRIEESGGKRPRTTTTTDESTATKTTTKTTTTSSHSMPKTPTTSHYQPSQKRFTKSNSSSKTSNNSTYGSHHRFGRVMEHVPCRNRPRYHTLSIAVPGSIVSNCQTKELRTHLVGQIARAATIYHVDEIVVFDDKLSTTTSSNTYEHRWRKGAAPPPQKRESQNDIKGDQSVVAAGGGEEQTAVETSSTVSVKSDPHLFMARLLQYCECPQYLRRQFFPMHPDLQFAGLLPPLDAPHHVRANDSCKYREGVVLDKTGANKMSLVNCGIPGRLVEIDRVLTPGIRCTVQLGADAYADQNNFHKANTSTTSYISSKKPVQGQVVSPSAPREDNGTYWGYTTRFADSLRAIFDECPYDGGYDVKIGTSERGSSVDDAHFRIKSFHHALIVFGGVAGIEECVDADESMKLPGSSSSTLFDLWLNTCPFQGSRTIRTEEAILVSLSRLNPFFVASGTKKEGKPKRGLVDANKANEPLPEIEFADDVSSEESD